MAKICLGFRIRTAFRTGYAKDAEYPRRTLNTKTFGHKKAQNAQKKIEAFKDDAAPDLFVSFVLLCGKELPWVWESALLLEPVTRRTPSIREGR